MVKFETRRDAKILVKTPSLRLLGKMFLETPKSKNQTMQKRYSETYQKRFRDFEILPKFSKTHIFLRYHSPPVPPPLEIPIKFYAFLACECNVILTVIFLPQKGRQATARNTSALFCRLTEPLFSLPIPRKFQSLLQGGEDIFWIFSGYFLQLHIEERGNFLACFVRIYSIKTCNKHVSQIASFQ